MQRSCILIAFLVLFQKDVNAQKEAYNWYFGNSAAIQFGTGPSPVAISPSSIVTNEGCASISDTAGVLLFYTDGITIWNRNHFPMPNGFGLMGDPSSTQSGVIVPYPGSANLYYVFTVDEESGPDGFRYSLVDMSLQGGDGDVTASKNILLLNQTTEKVTAAVHANGSDYWVVTHEFNTDAFYAYLITAAGINTIPIVTHTGNVHNGIIQNTIGYMKISPKGDKIALCVDYATWMEIFDFDNATGIITHPVIDYSFTGTGAYGLEFSPNGRYLYVGEEGAGNIYQYDLLAGSDSLIIATRITVASLATSVGAFQTGPDKKIYFTVYGNNFLGQIANPDLPGMACNLQQNAIPLSGTATFGLPNFISSYFRPFILQTNYCLDDTIFFTAINASGLNNLLWNFNDPASGPNDTSSLASTYHLFTMPGNFHITLVFAYNGVTDTIIKDITITDLPVVNLGNDTNICNGSSIVLYANTPGNTVTWNNGSQADTLLVNTNGNYTVSVQNSCGLASDTISVQLIADPFVFLGMDTLICDSGTFTINAYSPQPGISYLWQDGTTDSALIAVQPGLYFVVLTNKCASATDSINLDFDISPSLFIGNDTTLCTGELIYLDYSSSPYTFLWQDGSTLSYDTIFQTGIYYLTAFTKCGLATDTISVNFDLCEDCIKMPNIFTPNNDGFNEEFGPEIICEILNYRLQIYNRWGELMFTTDNFNIGWNGKKNNWNCPEGVYFYLLHFHFKNKKEPLLIKSSGSFTLIR